ncbi:phosphotransferase [Arthrobacter mobilis]|uniref:Phosphotransferase n=1 Tax=Arthrobacter mobilis TaxID=2724944 RepID=A0A7X6HBX1_9MICC|nr:phosphotransferase [Arthrobacter mobilis]NKX54259.1 phosphotransferase [Arthrobacter mobilis]
MCPLTPAQRRLLDEWLGSWQLVEEMSWQLQDITVLRLHTAAGDVVAKASGTSHHIDREIRAYRQMTAPLAGRTPELLHADAAAQLLVASYLPGRLVEGSGQEKDPELFRQAGGLLARLHQPGQQNNGYDRAVLHKIGDFADRAASLVPAAQLAAVRRLAAAHRPAPRLLYATHGDYQPRNWLVHENRLAVIDYGRAGYRPWVSDLVRLEHGWFGHDSGLRGAFYAGYGRTPDEEPEAWLLDNLLQSLGTVVWAHDVGDAGFEAEGRRMVGRVLERWG